MSGWGRGKGSAAKDHNENAVTSNEGGNRRWLALIAALIRGHNFEKCRGPYWI